jgi:hypothetical protein
MVGVAAAGQPAARCAVGRFDESRNPKARTALARGHGRCRACDLAHSSVLKGCVDRPARAVKGVCYWVQPRMMAALRAGINDSSNRNRHKCRTPLKVYQPGTQRTSWVIVAPAQYIPIHKNPASEYSLLPMGRIGEKIGVKYTAKQSCWLDIMKRIGFESEWWWPYKSLCFVSESPFRTVWDDRGRLHCENGPSVEYADGFKIYSLYGTRVPPASVD